MRGSKMEGGRSELNKDGVLRERERERDEEGGSSERDEFECCEAERDIRG